MRRIITCISLALLILSFSSSAQDLQKTDSIYRLLLLAPGDTGLTRSLNGSIDNLSYSQPDTALYYALQEDSLSRVSGYIPGSAMALNMQGMCYQLSGDMHKAIELFLQSVKLSQEHGLQTILCNVYNNLGNIYSYQGAFETSLDYQFKSLELAELLKDSSKMAANYNNIGLRYSELNQENRAIENYKMALKMNLQRKKYRNACSNYLNLGRGYVIKEQFDSAIYYYHRAIQIFDEHFPESMDKSLATNGLAYTYIHLDKLDSARHYLTLGREISERTNDFYGKLEAISLEGEILKLEKNYLPARRSFLTALDLSREAGLYGNEMDLHRELAEVSHDLGQNEKAYENFLRYDELKDSLFNVDKINEIANIEFTYQLDKQARQDSLDQVKAEMIRIEQAKQAKYHADRRNTLQYSGIALFVLIIFLIILMNRKLQMSDRILDLMIFIFFLILFEASLVAFDPLIDHLSRGEVLIKVICNSVLAFVIFTAHHFLEERMNRLISRSA